MERNLEQRYAIKFCYKVGKSVTETIDMLTQAYKEGTMSHSSIFERHKLFREGRELVEDDQRAGGPSTSRTDDNALKVRQLLNSDRRLGIKLISDEMNLSYGTVQRIITEDLSMKKVCAKMVQEVLSDEQEELRVEISQEILNCLEEDEHFLDNVITGDETWVFQYDPETKHQSEEWHTTQSTRKKKARMSKPKVKSMLIAFFTVVALFIRSLYLLDRL